MDYDKWKSKTEFTIFEICCLSHVMDPDTCREEIYRASINKESWTINFNHLHRQLKTDYNNGHFTSSGQADPALSKGEIFDWFKWKGNPCPNIFRATRNNSPAKQRALKNKTKRKSTHIIQKRLKALNALLNAMELCIYSNNYQYPINRDSLPFKKRLIFKWLKEFDRKLFNIADSSLDDFWKKHATTVCKLHRGPLSNDLKDDANWLLDHMSKPHLKKYNN